MRKTILLLLALFFVLMLSSCFWFGKSTTYPDMVEYSFEEVLNVAKEKYHIEKWHMNSRYESIYGEVEKQEDGTLVITSFNTQFSTSFVNGDNIDVAFTSFAGKNGGHDIQGSYRYFLCYVALGECEDGKLKFIYYNTNIHKDASIEETIGASDYAFEVSPLEIEDDMFVVDPLWTRMNSYLTKHFAKKEPANYTYTGERLMLTTYDRYNDLIYLEFYKEEGKIVYDLYYCQEREHPENKQLIYSTSQRYGTIYHYYGMNVDDYFYISQTVEQSAEDQNCMRLLGSVELKEIDGNILYSQISYKASYQVLYDDEVLFTDSSDMIINKTKFEKGFLIDKIDGVEHARTATFTLKGFYILYEITTD